MKPRMIYGDRGGKSLLMRYGIEYALMSGKKVFVASMNVSATLERLWRDFPGLFFVVCEHGVIVCGRWKHG